jgi:hypothetical protein
MLLSKNLFYIRDLKHRLLYERCIYHKRQTHAKSLRLFVTVNNQPGTTHKARGVFCKYRVPGVANSQSRVASVGVASVGRMGTQCGVASVGVASVESSRCRFRIG